MIAAFAAIAFLGQDKPAVDRSAESDLRHLFVSASNLRNAHVLISYYRGGSSDYYLPDHTNDVWLGTTGQFRVETNSLSGDSSFQLISDGMSVMSDPLNDDQTIEIDRANKPLYELVQREPLAFLLAGPNSFDKLVDKDQPVVFAAAPAGEKAIELHSMDLGKIVLVYKETDPLPVRVDLFRSMRRRDQGTESPTPTVREIVKVLSTSPQPSSMFVVRAPKGKKVEDNRTKTDIAKSGGEVAKPS